MKLLDYLISENKTIWNKYVNHPVGDMMVNNSLSLTTFKNYLSQDAIYLSDYKNIYFILLTKTQNLQEYEFIAKKLKTFDKSEYIFSQKFKNFNILSHNTKPSLETIAYTSFFYKIAHQGNYLDLLIAISVCTIGYGIFAKNLSSKHKKLIKTQKNNIFLKWISFYDGKWYQSIVDSWIDFLKNYDTNHLNNSQKKYLLYIFETIINLEIAFFNQIIKK